MMHQAHFNLSFPTYKKLNTYHLSDQQRFGLMFEKFIQAELIERGYTAALLTDFSARFDILVDSSLPIEVKSAKLTRRSNGRYRYQFCLSGGLNHLETDFVYCLVAVDQNGEIFTFVIPSAFVGNRRFIELSSHPSVYNGQWKQYLSAWQWIDTVFAWRDRLGQLPLFDTAVMI